MKINRHNYETFFLMYADNELSVEERKIVDGFVQDNPDLKPELESIIENILPTEDIVFPAAGNLYREEITLDQLQEDLLMHLDDELDETAKKEVEFKIKTDGQVEKEWKLWQQTKLDSRDKIIFSDKQRLYRYEKRGVVQMRMYRMAAAAVLLIGMFTAISVITNDKPQDNSVAKTGKNNAVENRGVGNIATNPVDKTPVATADEQAEAANNSVAGVIPVKDNSRLNVSSAKNTQDSNNSNFAAVQPQKKETVLENINNSNSNELANQPVLNNKREGVVYLNKAPGELAVTSPGDKVSAPVRTLTDYETALPKADNYARTAALTDGETESGNKIFYMSEETVNRSKVGGFLRKVKRVIERNTSINTGNGLKVAGFEFAVK